MKSVQEIYRGAELLINNLIRKESSAQGHFLTGALEDSLEGDYSQKGSAELLEGFAVYYTRFVNDGVPAESASYKQAPFLIQYFQARGLSEQEAVAAAFATINTWKKEGGMPTQASKRFSDTGSRTNMIENALVGAQPIIDEYMSSSFDFMMEELVHEEKNETI